MAAALGPRAAARGSDARAQPRHLRHRVRGLGTPARRPHGDGRRVRRRHVTPVCRWPAPSTARSPSTRSPTLLGLDREAVEPGGEAVLLPFLDGERTPNLPACVRAAARAAPRHHAAAAPQARLRRRRLHRAARARPGAARLRPATPDECGRPLLLIGGGAKGAAWLETVRRLSGRPLLVPRSAGAGRPRRRGPGGGAGDWARTRSAVARRWETAEGPSNCRRWSGTRRRGSGSRGCWTGGADAAQLTAAGGAPHAAP